jgi:simple sugar transport system ATP-binding protein
VSDNPSVAVTTQRAVDVQNLTVRFGATLALDNVTFSLETGRVHGLLGRNGAGKSTLVGVLAGLLAPTEGSVEFFPDIHSTGSDQRREPLVGTVFQHSMLVPNLTVAENMALATMPRRKGVIDWSSAREAARLRLQEWGLDIDARRLAGDLSVAERQIVEIVRELSRGARIVILDEPTSRIAGADVERLHSHVVNARDQGVTFIYISHHLNEVMELCDTATILKDGRLVSQKRIVESTTDDIIRDMVGSASSSATRVVRPQKSRGIGLEVRGLKIPGLEVDQLSVAAGEMVGVAGLVGSGKELLAEAISGSLPNVVVDVTVAGRVGRVRNEADAIGLGIASVPEDRHRLGLVLGLGVGENMTMSIASRLSRILGFLSPQRRTRRASELGEEVTLKANSLAQEARFLSGGNQQKAVLARALAIDPSVLVLLNPTAGVDVASKAAIYDTIARRQETGLAVLMISDELEEYAGCSRVIVLRSGRVAEELRRPWTVETLLAEIEGVTT